MVTKQILSNIQIIFSYHCDPAIMNQYIFITIQMWSVDILLMRPKNSVNQFEICL